MDLIRPGTKYDFIGKKKYTLLVSCFTILISLGSIFYHGGLRNGVDFAGGVLIQIKFSKAADISEVRSALDSVGAKEAVVQAFGGENEFLIRMEKTEGDMDTALKAIQASLQEKFKDKAIEILRAEAVGPKVGQDLRKKAVWAVLLSFAGILVYVAIRFHDLSYGLGGIVSLVHDVIVVYGAISILNLEYSLPLLAVVLTIIGYSINDTIVIFDRVRENVKKIRKEELETIFNISINETLGRTILTTSTVMLVALVLFFLGGSVIHDFATALIVGVVTGTYSTIYIASPVVLLWEQKIRGKRKSR